MPPFTHPPIACATRAASFGTGREGDAAMSEFWIKARPWLIWPWRAMLKA